MKHKNKNNNLFLICFVILCCLNFNAQAQQYSIGKLTILNHTAKSAMNKTITLNPLLYHQHLPNLEMHKLKVVKADPFDACAPIDSKKYFPNINQNYPDTFLLVDGQIGQCNYWKKAQNAKQALLKGIIIIDDDPEKNSNRPADFSDGLFLSFLITQKDAKIILAANSTQFQGKLIITQSSQLKQKKKITIWLSSLNPQSYEYLHWWNETLQNLHQLESKVQWEPKYVFYGQPRDQTKYVYSCACNGLFCSPQFHGKTSDVLIKQDLRQKIIFRDYQQKYLSYINIFVERCLQNYLESKYAQQCSRTQMINLQINQSQVNKQIQNFLFSCDRQSQMFSQLITDKGRFSMIGSYPIFLLNRQILQINNQNDLQALMCRQFSLEQSQGCIQNYRTTIPQIVISIVFFLLILAGLFGVGFFVVMCYKNRLRKQMHKQVKMQVSTAVEHYFQLSQETGGAKN